MQFLKRCMTVGLCMWLCAISVHAGDEHSDSGVRDAAVQAAEENEAALAEAARMYGTIEDGADTYENEDIDYESGIAAARMRTSDTGAKSAAEPLRVPIVVDGDRASISAYLFADGVSYLSLREAAALLFPNAAVGWDPARGVATLSGGGLSLSAPWGQPYIEANGRYFALSGLYPAENLLVNGVTYVPLRSLARAAGADIEWNARKRCAEIVTGQSRLVSGKDHYDANDVYWLSKIIYAEAGDQSLRGQLAVGAVVRNRQAHPAYPDTVYGVIFDRNHGVQFSPVADGAINKSPSQKSIVAAKLVLDGCMISYEAIYFLDPSIATSKWIVENCEFLFTIGCHDFYI